jgi:hypothetical protein
MYLTRKTLFRPDFDRGSPPSRARFLTADDGAETRGDDGDDELMTMR